MATENWSAVLVVEELQGLIFFSELRERLGARALKGNSSPGETGPPSSDTLLR